MIIIIQDGDFPLIDSLVGRPCVILLRPVEGPLSPLSPPSFLEVSRLSRLQIASWLLPVRRCRLRLVFIHEMNLTKAEKFKLTPEEVVIIVGDRKGFHRIEERLCF